MLKFLLDDNKPVKIRVTREGRITLSTSFRVEGGGKRVRGIQFLPLSSWVEGEK